MPFKKGTIKNNRLTKNQDYEKILQIIEHNPVIVFNLRRGVRFHDGHEFDAGDVIFTYRAIMDPKNTSPRRSDYEPVKSAKILGPYKISFIFDSDIRLEQDIPFRA